LGGGEVPKKRKSPVAPGVGAWKCLRRRGRGGGRGVVRALYERDLSGKETALHGRKA